MDLEEKIMELSRYGYACGQILGILLLDTIGEENPALIRCMQGLNGGIGSSGFGSYHGKLTFETFCHRKPVMFKPSFPDLPPRYPDSPSLLKRLLGIKK